MPAPADATRMPSAKPRRARGALAAAAMSGKTPSSLVTWYLGLTHHWMGDNPRIKTRILLGTHDWIIGRVLAPEVRLADLAADLRPEGALTQSLAAQVPPDDAAEWRHFIDLVVANLRHALLVPVTQHNEAWVRWLFLIPYSIRQTAEAVSAPAAPAQPETRQDAATNGSATVTDRAPVWQVARV